MNWRKKGLVFQPDTDLWWSKSFAGMPTAELLNEKTIRVYYYSVDGNMDGRISYIDLDASNPSKVLYIHKNPIFDIGEDGLFDDCGVCASAILKRNGRKFLYYVGVQRTEKLPYHYFAGLAVEEKENVWTRVSKTPILDRLSEEPFVRSATTIVDVGDHLKMWYVSAFRWIRIGERRVPNYRIRHAVSGDGIHWENKGGFCLDFKDDDEYGFGRPCVIKDGEIFKMWYSIRSRSKNYRIGYAESADGKKWIRLDEEVGIDVSPDGWDSQMICYPSIVDAAGKRYMFHNGNGHGQSGFGYAVLES
jgi:predicted GH43/DUF377 family glycosyl hydrolase